MSIQLAKKFATWKIQIWLNKFKYKIIFDMYQFYEIDKFAFHMSFCTNCFAFIFLNFLFFFFILLYYVQCGCIMLCEFKGYKSVEGFLLFLLYAVLKVKRKKSTYSASLLSTLLCCSLRVYILNWTVNTFYNLKCLRFVL